MILGFVVIGYWCFNETYSFRLKINEKGGSMFLRNAGTSYQTTMTMPPRCILVRNPGNKLRIYTEHHSMNLLTTLKSQCLWVYSYFRFTELKRNRRSRTSASSFKGAGWHATYFSYYTNRSMIPPEWIVHHLFSRTTNITRYKRQNK